MKWGAFLRAEWKCSEKENGTNPFDFWNSEGQIKLICELSLVLLMELPWGPGGRGLGGRLWWGCENGYTSSKDPGHRLEMLTEIQKISQAHWGLILESLFLRSRAGSRGQAVKVADPICKNSETVLAFNLIRNTWFIYNSANDVETAFHFQICTAGLSQHINIYGWM